MAKFYNYHHFYATGQTEHGLWYVMMALRPDLTWSMLSDIVHHMAYELEDHGVDISTVVWENKGVPI